MAPAAHDHEAQTVLGHLSPNIDYPCVTWGTLGCHNASGTPGWSGSRIRPAISCTADENEGLRLWLDAGADHISFDAPLPPWRPGALTALGCCAFWGSAGCAEVLLGLGANPDEGNNTAPIVLAAKQGHAKVRKAEARQTVYLSARLWLSG